MSLRTSCLDSVWAKEQAVGFDTLNAFLKPVPLSLNYQNKSVALWSWWVYVWLFWCGEFKVATSLNSLFMGVTFQLGGCARRKQRVHAFVTQYQGDWKWHKDFQQQLYVE